MTKLRRLFATLIDFLFIFFSVYVPGYIIQHILNANILVLIIVTVLSLTTFVLLIVMKDNFFGNRSIGKKLFCLKIFSNKDKEVLDKYTLKKRNIETLKIFPLYIFMVLINNKSCGDIQLNTVIKSEELNVFKSIIIILGIFMILIILSILYTV